MRATCKLNYIMCVFIISENVHCICIAFVVFSLYILLKYTLLELIECV